MPPKPRNSRSEFFGRLAYYAIGFSIGLVFLTLWKMERRAIVARETQAAQEAHDQAVRRQAEELGTPAPVHAPPEPVN